MSKEAYYFSHDANARQDPKISALMSVYGAEGYGWYWILVEMLREQSDYTLDKQGKYTFNALAMQMHCKRDAAEKFVHDCIEEFELFDTDGVKFWSNSLLRRMAMREELSQKRKKAAEKRWSKQEKDTNDMQMHSTSNADGMQGKEKKVKEKKVKEIKINKNKYADYVSMTQEEYEKLVNQFGETGANERIVNLDLYKGSKGVDYKNDYLTILSWERKNSKDQKKSIFNQGEESKKRQEVIKPLTAEEQERLELWEEELPF
jgi:hypothetical protein